MRFNLQGYALEMVEDGDRVGISSASKTPLTPLDAARLYLVISNFANTVGLRPLSEDGLSYMVQSNGMGQLWFREGR